MAVCAGTSTAEGASGADVRGGRGWRRRVEEVEDAVESRGLQGGRLALFRK